MLPSLPRPLPHRATLEGRYARLEPLDAKRHAADLWVAASAPGEAARFRFLFHEAPRDAAAMEAWCRRAQADDTHLFFAVVDKETGCCGGRQALERVTAAHGVIELGSIYWGPGVARTRLATEAFFLHASYVFDTLGYRRLEWKCDARHAASRAAAERFGFSLEGVFRQHMVVKGESRDTSWYALLDSEWPRVRDAIARWLEPDNFDAGGRQRSRLATPNWR